MWLQSTGERLKVHMSGVFRAIYMAASNDGQAGPERITFEPRTVKAKGKGVMETFLCTDLNAGRSTDRLIAGDGTQASEVAQCNKANFKGKRQRRLSVSVTSDGNGRGGRLDVAATTVTQSWSK